MRATYFTKGGYVGTDDAATHKERLGNREAKTLHLRRSHKYFTLCVTPLQLWLG
jgi:hypothetical protein